MATTRAIVPVFFELSARPPTLTLALGVGTTTAVFAVVDTVLLRPLPFTDPAQMVLIRRANTSGMARVDPASVLRAD